MSSAAVHLLSRVSFGAISTVSFVVAALLIRAAYRINKRAKMGRLAASLLDFADADFQDFFRLLEQRRGKGALFSRYLGAFVFVALGVVAAAMMLRAGSD